MPKPLSAQELLRAQGLPADGPVLWGQPARSRAPGIFIVEMATSMAHAPLDITAVRTWVDRVPGLQPEEIVDVIVGCGFPEAKQGMNLGRRAALDALDHF